MRRGAVIAPFMERLGRSNRAPGDKTLETSPASIGSQDAAKKTMEKLL
jgi:hypothetical protein